jgi:hypothetical protein
MRKTVLILFTLLISHAVLAQVSFGVKAGPNFSWMKMETDSLGGSDKGKPGFHAGGFVVIRLSDKFSLASELVYSNQGLQNKDYKLHFDYLTLPFLGRFSPGKLSFDAGVIPGFLAARYSSPSDGNFPEIYSQFNLDVAAGLNIAVSKNVGLSLRYNHGLTNIISKDAGNTSYRYAHNGDPLIIGKNLRDEGWEQRNRTIQLSVMYESVQKLPCSSGKPALKSSASF